LINPQDLVVISTGASRGGDADTVHSRFDSEQRSYCHGKRGCCGTGLATADYHNHAPDFPSARVRPLGAQGLLGDCAGRSIAAVDIQYGGSGYFQPLATITMRLGLVHR